MLESAAPLEQGVPGNQVVPWLSKLLQHQRLPCIPCQDEPVPCNKKMRHTCPSRAEPIFRLRQKPPVRGRRRLHRWRSKPLTSDHTATKACGAPAQAHRAAAGAGASSAPMKLSLTQANEVLGNPQLEGCAENGSTSSEKWNVGPPGPCAYIHMKEQAGRSPALLVCPMAMPVPFQQRLRLWRHRQRSAE